MPGESKERVYLGGINLKGAILAYANLKGANLYGANLAGANLCRTTLPEGSNLDPNRDCKALSIDPKTGELIP